jgi:hypothetical protein
VANAGFHLAGIPLEPQAAEKLALHALAVNGSVISDISEKKVMKPDVGTESRTSPSSSASKSYTRVQNPETVKTFLQQSRSEVNGQHDSC